MDRISDNDINSDDVGIESVRIKLIMWIFSKVNYAYVIPINGCLGCSMGKLGTKLTFGIKRQEELSSDLPKFFMLESEVIGWYEFIMSTDSSEDSVVLLL